MTDKGQGEKKQDKFDELLKEIEQKPDFIEVNDDMANYCLEREEQTEVESHVARTLVLNPNSAEAHFRLGLIHFAKREFNEAEKRLQKALELNPLLIEAHFNLGLLYKGQAKYQEAMAHFQKVILAKPGHVKAYNHLGECCLEANMRSAAERLFRQAINLDPNFFEAAFNLGNLYYKENRIDDIIGVFENIGDNKNVYIYNLLAECYLLKGNYEKAVKQWRRSLKINPGQEDISAKLHDYMKRKKNKNKLLSGSKEAGERAKLKVAFFCGPDDRFLTDIINYFAKKCWIRRFDGKTIEGMYNLMQWSDISWFEWCDELVVQASRLKKVCKMICRLHSYEAFEKTPGRVNWENIDTLILVNKTIKDILLERFTVKTDIIIIPPLINTKKFFFPERKIYGKKVAYVGYINYKKNPALMLQCFKAIHDYDAEYTFHIAGKYGDLRYKIYFEDMCKRLNLDIQFDGWVDNVWKWYEDKDYVISSSLFEAFHTSIAEGIMMGVLPLVHTWRGSEEIYPKDSLYATPQECVEVIKRYEKLAKYQVALRNRKDFEMKYSLDKQIEKIEKVLTSNNDTMKDIFFADGKENGGNLTAAKLAR